MADELNGRIDSVVSWMEGVQGALNSMRALQTEYCYRNERVYQLPLAARSDFELKLISAVHTMNDLESIFNTLRGVFWIYFHIVNPQRSSPL